MIEIKIPGGNKFVWKHLVLDYNGTLAKDGLLKPGVVEILEKLAENLTIHVVTADTFGTVAKSLKRVPCQLALISQTAQDQAKQDYIEALGRTSVVAIGNGRNDRLMIQAAGLGIAVIQEEGAFGGTILAAEVVCNSIVSALKLLCNPSRLKATLRI